MKGFLKRGTCNDLGTGDHSFLMGKGGLVGFDR